MRGALLLDDQFTNRKPIVDDWKIGTNLCDRKVVKKEGVLNKINHLMDVKAGDEFRKAAAKVRKTLEDALKPNGSSAEQNMDTFKILSDNVINVYRSLSSPVFTKLFQLQLYKNDTLKNKFKDSKKVTSIKYSSRIFS